MSDVIEARHELAAEVDDLLIQIKAGMLPDAAERARVDVQEEAGRRDRAGILRPGRSENPHAAIKLADEVACFANTLGGGALVVGIENATGDLPGTALDAEWLRHRIYGQVDVAPAVEERLVEGVRLLVLYEAMAPQPVEDTGGRIRWRVGPHCQPVDRSGSERRTC